MIIFVNINLKTTSNRHHRMKWYHKYLAAYGKPFKEVPSEVIAEVRNRILRLQSAEPLVSVVVIAHNEEKHLFANLWSLSDTISRFPIEIIGVDNNSTDCTAKIYEAVGVPCHAEPRQSHGHARNCGLEHAKGKYHVCIDSDTLYPPHYVETMVEALSRPGVSGVYSLWGYMPDRDHSALGLFFYELSRDIYLRLQSINRPELSVRGMVFAFVTEQARQIGFRVNIKRGEDGAMANGLKQFGKLKFISARKARAITGYGTVGQSLFKSFKARAIKALKRIKLIFTRQKEYKDIESNLIK